MRMLMTVALLLVAAMTSWAQAPGAPGAPPAAGVPAAGGGGGRGGIGGMGGPGGMGMGMGAPWMGMPWMGGQGGVAPVMMIVDGVVYIAYGGKVTAFEAKTLNKLGEATYFEPPKFAGFGPGGPGGPGGGAGAAGGPVAPPGN